MDRVQVLKRETADLGGDPFDEQPWPEPIQPQEDAVEVAGVYFQDASNRDESTLIDRNGDDMQFKDGNNPTPVTLTDLLGAAGAHETINSLVHNLSETMYQEITRTGGRVSGVVWWANSGKTLKIRELSLTRTAGKVSSVVLTQYDDSGTLIQTLTGTVNRVGGRVANIEWVET